MNLTKLFETQAELDHKIVEEKGLQGQDLLDKKILALQVELGELANEWQMFKFWKEDKAPIVKSCDRCDEHGMLWAVDPNTGASEPLFACDCENPLLVEYVDCLHFILSIGNDGSFNEKESMNLIHPNTINHNIEVYKESDVTSQFKEMFFAVNGHIYHNNLESYEEVFLYFVALGEQLGFTWKEIEQAYYEKNEINHARQANGY